MIKGEVRVIGRTLTLTSAYTFDTPPVLTVTAPDDTTSTPPVAVSPDTSNVTQQMTAQIEFPMGGAYRLVWDCDAGNNDVIKLRDLYWAAYTNMHDMIRSAPIKYETPLTDSVIDYTIARIMRSLNSSFPTLPAYKDITDTQVQEDLDEALAYFTMVKLRTSGVIAVPTGSLLSYQFEQTKFQFSQSASASSKSMEDVWFGAGMDAFQRIPEMAELFLERRQARFLGFHITGPSRQRIQTYGQSMLSNAASLLSDAINFDNSNVLWPVG